MSGGGGSAPNPPKLKKVDIGQAEDMAVAQDKNAYALSDADFAQRFPWLVSGRDYMISDAQKQMGGAISDQATGALQSAGLGAEGASIQGKSEFATARNLGQPLLAKEQRDRNFVENLLAQNPQRKIGASGEDAVRILEGNTGNANAFNQAAYGTQLGNYNAGIAQEAQNFGAITSLVGGLATDFSRYYTSNQSPYTNPYTMFYTPMGTYGGGYSFQGSPDFNPDIGVVQPSGGY